jgi:Caspase domain/Protein of unknown function (DUF1566)
MQKEGTIAAWPSSARRSEGTRLACFGNVRALWVFGSHGPLAALLTLVLALLLATPAHAKRIALVVGNAAYTDKPLTNPVNDAELMQRTLQGLGFEVSLLRNASRRDLLSGLRDFEAKAADAEVALFYFAGHGTQVAGNNYLIPLQAQIRAESDVPDEAVDAGSVLRRMENARAKVGLVVLDACRDNPYAGASRSSVRGLGRMSVPTGSIVAYATAPGSTADDGKGRNGVYTEQLAKHLSTPGLDLREVFDRTAVEVERLTGGKQKPREDIGLRGRLVLKPGAATQVASVVPEPVIPLVPVPSPGQVSGTSLEDLQREEAARKEWAQWQARMKADFDKTAAFSGGNDLQVKAWERYLNAWRQDNPLSQDDEGLRSQATARVERLRGEMQAAVAAPATAASSASSGSSASLIDGRYQVLGDGSEVKDTKTGLIWQRCSEGQSWTGSTCAGVAQIFQYAQAAYINRSGWRLPTVRELHSLIQCSSGRTSNNEIDIKDGGGALSGLCVGENEIPTIARSVFPETPLIGFWTSSTYFKEIWHVFFKSGFVGSSSVWKENAVRLVRVN